MNSFCSRTNLSIIAVACLIGLSSHSARAGEHAAPPAPPELGISTITVEDAKIHLNMLAADSMMGRNTPSPQLEIAARYIADRFREYGLQPLHGSYFQEYALSRINLGTPNRLALRTGGHPEAVMTIKDDYVPYDFTAGDSCAAGIVFAGYGITAPEYQYDDYAGIDVTGKIVFVLRHEPDEKGADSTFFRGKKWTRHLEIRSKMLNAMKHGAIGMLVVNDPANHMLLKPEGYPWPSLFFKSMTDADLPVTLDLGERKSIPAIHCGEKVMQALFGSVDSLTAMQKRIDSTRTPHSYALDASAQIRITLEKTIVNVPNVVGWWPGDLADSTHIVIGAHMDHVGTTHATAPGQDTIYNGADDNASGTTGLLEVARAFAATPIKPHRSVMFIAFSGEEKGLYGSRSYAARPLVPLGQCAAMLNMDMIGRNDHDSLELGGAGHSPELTSLAEKENAQVGMKIKEDDDFLGRSDQASFSSFQIPVLFFFTGEHKDYHQVTDSADKIDFEKLVHVARLCFRTAWDIAESDTRFVVR